MRATRRRSSRASSGVRFEYVPSYRSSYADPNVTCASRRRPPPTGDSEAVDEASEAVDEASEAVDEASEAFPHRAASHSPVTVSVRPSRIVGREKFPGGSSTCLRSVIFSTVSSLIPSTSSYSVRASTCLPFPGPHDA